MMIFQETRQRNVKKILNSKIQTISLLYISRINEFGYKIEPFNMNADREEGQIDETGYYVFNKNKMSKLT